MSDHAPARFRATIHYDGAGFHGWQLQPDRRTVQLVLEKALERLLTVPTRVDAAGRTDSGVHAVGQEIAFGAPDRWRTADLHRGLNALTPDDVWIWKLGQAAADFHPRFQATGRRYEYLVAVGTDADSPLRSGRAWAVTGNLDEKVLRRATQRIVGERSFGSFAKSGQPERGTRCRIERAGWTRTAVGDLRFEVVADRFLHHMVRYLVATLIEVATGRREEVELERLLEEGDGARAPSPAPSCGLYLTGVRYEEGWNRSAGIPGVADIAPENS